MGPVWFFPPEVVGRHLIEWSLSSTRLVHLLARNEGLRAAHRRNEASSFFGCSILKWRASSQNVHRRRPRSCPPRPRSSPSSSSGSSLAPTEFVPRKGIVMRGGILIRQQNRVRAESACTPVALLVKWAASPPCTGSRRGSAPPPSSRSAGCARSRCRWGTEEAGGGRRHSSRRRNQRRRRWWATAKSKIPTKGREGAGGEEGRLRGSGAAERTLPRVCRASCVVRSTLYPSKNSRTPTS